jgi:hypothetical protein
MAAKFDKDKLIKHRFWILSGCFLLLVLIPLIVFASGVSDTVKTAVDKYNSKSKDLKNLKDSDIKNDSWVEAYKYQDGLIDARKNEVWKEAWLPQGDFMTWPRALEREWSQKYAYFGDPIDDRDADKFTLEYQTQLAPMELYALVDPVRPNGKGGFDGAVQFHSGDPDAILHLRNDFTHQKPPTDADIWLLQEDLWVKRELLRIVAEANYVVSLFREVPMAPAPGKAATPPPAAKDAKDTKDAKDAPAPAKEAKDTKDGKAAPPEAPKSPAQAPTAVLVTSDPNHKRFRNPYWELDLTLSTNSSGKRLLKGTVTNISKRRQPLECTFRVYLGDYSSAPGLLEVIHDPVSVGEKVTIPETVLPDSLSGGGLAGVEEVLTWRTAPVKRIDRVEMGEAAHDSRTVYRSLKPPRWLNVKKDDTQSAPPPNAPQGPGTTMPMFGKGNTADSSTTKNGLIINRYLDTNEQVRHLPVGLVVVADEDLMAYLLGAFTNSKLRIETTQYHWTHIREKIRPQEQQETASNRPTTGSPAPGVAPGVAPGGNKFTGNRGGPMTPGSPPGGSGSGSFNPGMMGGLAPNPMMMMRGQMPGMPPVQSRASGPGIRIGGSRPLGGGLTTSHEEAEEDEETNLVEVSVYGIAALYERFPAKPPSPTTTSK